MLPISRHCEFGPHGDGMHGTSSAIGRSKCIYDFIGSRVDVLCVNECGVAGMKYIIGWCAKMLGRKTKENICVSMQII